MIIGQIYCPFFLLNCITNHIKTELCLFCLEEHYCLLSHPCIPGMYVCNACSLAVVNSLIEMSVLIVKTCFLFRMWQWQADNPPARQECGRRAS